MVEATRQDRGEEEKSSDYVFHFFLLGLVFFFFFGKFIIISSRPYAYFRYKMIEHMQYRDKHTNIITFTDAAYCFQSILNCEASKKL